MNKNLSSSDLIQLVADIMNANVTEQEIEHWLNTFRQHVPHPQASDLIFYSEHELTPEEIVAIALAHKSIQL